MEAVATEPAQLQSQRALEGLTPKQYQFVKIAFSGVSFADAYRQVYDCSGMSAARIAQAASVEMSKPNVAAKLRDLREASDRQVTLAPLATREFVMNGLMDLAINGDKDSVRLGAYVWIGKSSGIDMFREHTVIEKRERTPEDIDRELRERLAEMQRTLNLDAKDVTPAAARAADQPAPADRRRKPKAG